MLFIKTLCEKKYILFFLFILILSGCSDKPITFDDISGIGDDIAEVFGKDDSDNYGDSKSVAMLEIPPSLDLSLIHISEPTRL